MPIYKPSELRQFLNQLGIQPKKALSQNFLIDGNIIRKIVGAAALKKDDLVAEVGPGPGSLSEALLEAGASLIAVEQDKILAEALKRLQTPDNRLEVFCEDILKLPIETVLKEHLGKGQKAKLIANLPYHLTTLIILKFIPLRELISSLIIMVQDEVARRYTSQPGSKEYGSITIFLNYYCTPRYLFTVGRNCFYPAPKVDSAVVELQLKEPPKVSNEARFFQMVRRAFEHRRKMLRASLQDLYPSEKVMEGLKKIGLAPEARPEQLSLDHFISLFHLLENAISG